ncbi:radical SAM/SPASM domain-containing protein [Nisaea sp.]|uniref:radical SAM/SPASM domain-containing protein n=1 Tax=Nisaea sp. TaxID=2024842 RepID=UPI002B2791EC|nr:radical SAM/SPASM domain-containing protein [Nisaea sp.]
MLSFEKTPRPLNQEQPVTNCPDDSQVRFFDPSIHRKRLKVDAAISRNIEGIPLPSVVEISESGTCNRKCSFCPRSANWFEDIKEFISFDLLKKLCVELSEVDYSGTIMFSGFVEPMIDKQIFEKISLVRKTLPKARIEMITNGDILNRERLDRIIDCGLNTLLISAYDDKETAEGFEKLARDAGYGEDQVIVRHRYLPPEQDFGITMTNRGGTLDEADHKRPSLTEPLKQKCFYPHYTFFMDYLGDVIICTHDWAKRKIVGNLKDQSFLEIWLSDEMNKLRRKLSQADRSESPCNVCDAVGTLIGENHAKAWDKLLGVKEHERTDYL